MESFAYNLEGMPQISTIHMDFGNVKGVVKC